MIFLNPLGWLLSLLLPLIILLHLKKQQFIQREVSYLGLWEEVIKEVEGIKKNRINKYLLLFIQLLIGILIVMAFARPMWIKPFKGESLTIVLDNSLTMRAEEDGVTEIEKAKKEIKKYIKNIDDDISIDFVTIGRKIQTIVKGGSKNQVLNELDAIQPTYEVFNIKNKEAIFSTFPEPIVFFTNKNILLGDENIKIGDGINNIGIIDGKFDYYNRAALFKIRNYGEKNKEIILELKDEINWQDIRKINIPSREVVNVNWTDIPLNIDYLKIYIKEEDTIYGDNEFVLPIGDKYKKKVLMIGENYFLNRALKSLPYIKLTNIKKYKDIKEKFDLYIINERLMEKKLWEDKNIWYLKPPEEMVEGYLDKYSEMKIADELFSEDIILRDSYLKDFSYLKEDENFKTILKAEDKTVMAYEIEDKGKKIYSTIDFNKTNFSMKTEFPILIDNIIKWFLKEDKRCYEPGEEIYIKESNIRLKTPTKEININGEENIKLREIGKYNLIDRDKNIKTFFVNPPKEENIKYDFLSREKKKINKFHFNNLNKIDLKNIIICLLLLLMILEWEVFKNAV
ncbi:BatA domain-containing protein [Maledivibacter halophilus]|uniref:Aerotolerance regulator N-terminal n=1 Tax=Maledivibacter halophilus TaxID=36842 RepID=A0A1T5J3B4_9FIRM|nr:BatA domain-containing protein [Maledivibacter halophilus]SKC45811.1 Aerotolerance regulator N-terminal [Maledivibacter halophilus]